MSVHDETWDRCKKCGGVVKSWHGDRHDSGQCLDDLVFMQKVEDIVADSIVEPDYKLIAERLWEILDDIDTATDHYKPNNDDKFVRYVYAKLKERHSYMKSDGYKLTAVQKTDIPIMEDLDPMTRWFKDAWNIERNN